MNLEILMMNVRDSERAVKEELIKRWPENRRVQVFLRRGQKYPSDGMVLSHNGSKGTIRVSIDRKPDPCGRFQRPFVRDIHYSDVCP